MTSILLFLLTLSTFAFTVPPFTPNVVDKTGTLSEAQIEDINKEIDRAHSKGVLPGVLLVKTLGGEPIEDVAEKVFKKWELGQKGKDNGILILIATEDRQMRIEVGYGLEGKITDHEASEIINRIMKPNFKEGHFSSGIIGAIERMTLVATGEFKPYSKPIPQKADRYFFSAILIWTALFLLLPMVIGTIGMKKIKSRLKPKDIPPYLALMKRAQISPKYLHFGTPSNEGLLWRIFFCFFLSFPVAVIATDDLNLDFQLLFYFFALQFIVFSNAFTAKSVWLSLSEERLKKRVADLKAFRKKSRYAWKGGSSRSSSSSSSTGFSSSSSSSSRSSSSSGGRSGGGGASGSW